ncbi:MAG: DMT family transporter [candidate division WOR-3 bacterium]
MLGELAALTTALLWTATSVFFTLSGRKVGSQIVNRTRLVFGFLFLCLLHFIVYREFLPFSIEISYWLWFGLSGIIGLVIGDSALFQSFILIGPHLSMLIMTLVPIIGAVFAWLFLSEVLSPLKIIGILCTLSGIVLVILKKLNSNITSRKNYATGICLATIGAISQATGLIIAKKGLSAGLNGLSATLIRVAVATIIIWLITIFTKQFKTTINKVFSSKVVFIIMAGAFCGPFLGIWMSMNAIKWTYIGIASTLMALPPVFLLPISYLIFKEKITLLSLLGTLIAVIGIGLIFLS